MVLGLVLRVLATQRLGSDFNWDLRVRPDQEVLEAGPYRRLRHPGYLGVGLYLMGLMVVFAFWPLVVVAGGLLGYSLWARVENEERINCEAMAGYEDYMHRVRWRLIPGVW